MAWYKTGTVEVTNGSATVTGTGTNWFGALQAGWGFSAPDGRIYEIANVASDTSLTLATNYLGANATGQTYACWPTMSLAADLTASLQQLISDYQSVVDGPGAGKFLDGTLLAPGMRFTADPDTGLRRTAANAAALVAGGVDRLTFGASGVAIPNGLNGTSIGALVPSSGVFTSLTVRDTANTILKVEANSGFSAIYPRGSGTNPAYIFLGNETTGETGRLATDNNGRLSFWTGTGSVAQQATIDASGMMSLLHPTMKLGGASMRGYRTTLVDDAQLNFSTPGASGLCWIVPDNGNDYPDINHAALFWYDTGGSIVLTPINVGSSVMLNQENSDGYLNIKGVPGHYLRLTNKTGGPMNYSVFTSGGDGA